MPITIAEFIKNLPKVELHVHLEGAVTPAIWKEQVMRNKVESLYSAVEPVDDHFSFDSFMGFIAVFRDVLLSFRSPEDFYHLTQSFLKGLADQQVRYCEVMMTPWFVMRQGIDFREMMAEIDRAAREAEQQHNIEMKLLFDGPRNFGNQVVREVFELAVSDRTGRVIGVGLGGDEKNYPAEDFAEEFAFARSHGMKTIAHAGETAGEVSMLAAIEKLGATRLGHCLGIPENSRLEEVILEQEITLDLCPGSNLATGSLKTIEDHPLNDYLHRGYSLTLNSDDPGIFATSLTKEFEMMATLHHLNYEQLAGISLNSVKGSFLSDSRKCELKREIEKALHNSIS